MKKLLAVCILSFPLFAQAERPPMYDPDCVNSKHTLDMDDAANDAAIEMLRTGECALHGEYYQVNEYWAAQNNWGQEDLTEPHGYITTSFYISYHDAVLQQAAINKKALGSRYHITSELITIKY